MVLISSDGSASSGATAASMVAGSISGSSPCTLTMARQGSWLTTSAMRSVPLTWSARVINAAPPNARTTSAMRSSSVATITACTLDAAEARRYTCSIIGRPAMSARIFPGRRVAWNLAGMTARTDDSVSVNGRRSTELGCTSNHTTRYCGDPGTARRSSGVIYCVSCKFSSEMALVLTARSVGLMVAAARGRRMAGCIGDAEARGRAVSARRHGSASAWLAAHRAARGKSARAPQ